MEPEGAEWARVGGGVKAGEALSAALRVRCTAWTVRRPPQPQRSTSVPKVRWCKVAQSNLERNEPEDRPVVARYAKVYDAYAKCSSTFTTERRS